MHDGECRRGLNRDNDDDDDDAVTSTIDRVVFIRASTTPPGDGHEREGRKRKRFL